MNADNRAVTDKQVIVGALILALCLFAGFALLGKLGDCSPHEIDGQCGMSTFMGLVFGLFAAIATLVAAAAYIGIRTWLQKRRSQSTL